MKRYTHWISKKLLKYYPGLVLVYLLALFPIPHAVAQECYVLKPGDFEAYISSFNKTDNELYPQHIANADSWNFLKRNIPFFDCPDKALEKTYYFRWWTFRKHIKKTEAGFVITEFLPAVPWAGKYNTISCPVGHHFYEGRWLRDRRYLIDNAKFWLSSEANPRSYSTWLADGIWNYYAVSADDSFITGLLTNLVANYTKWEIGWTANGFFTGRNADGLFSSIDGNDGMEVSVGGSGKRATINSYMYGDALAISKIALLAKEKKIHSEYLNKATKLRSLVLDKLWDNKSHFFKTLNKDGQTQLRELHGYTPWYFDLPPDQPKFNEAWKQIADRQGFAAPYGLTTAEQRDPHFTISYEGHECQWNGPSWPFATSVTLTALANHLNSSASPVISEQEYFNQLLTYAKSHLRTTESGETLPWIDENLNPYTGDWISRTRLKIWKNDNWSAEKGGVERGKDYNHSTFCDLIISGLIGLRPSEGSTIIVNPLIPETAWDWFCLDGITYHNKTLTIFWDKTGTRYNRGKGFHVMVDGEVIGYSSRLQKLTFGLDKV